MGRVWTVSVTVTDLTARGMDMCMMPLTRHRLRFPRNRSSRPTQSYA